MITRFAKAVVALWLVGGAPAPAADPAAATAKGTEDAFIVPRIIRALVASAAENRDAGGTANRPPVEIDRTYQLTPLMPAATYFRRNHALATAGNSTAQNVLGDLFFHGCGTPQDLGEAARWYRKSAENDNPDGHFSLGMMYSNGVGVAQDEHEARKWLTESAKRKHEVAQVRLADSYDRGNGLERDVGAADAWDRIAGNLGNAEARTKRAAVEKKMNAAQISRAAEPARELDGESVLTIEELLSRKRSDLDDHVIRVKGFLFFKAPESALYPSETGFKTLPKGPALWIGADKVDSIAARTPRPHLAWVVIEGTFKDKPAGMFDAYFAQLEEIVIIQAGAKDSRTDGAGRPPSHR